MFTETLHRRQALSYAQTTTINSGSTASLNTTGISMANLRRLRAFFMWGTVTGGGTVTIALQASATQGGSYANISGNTTNPVMAGVTPTSNTVSALEVRADQLPAGTVWVRAIATETGAQNVVTTILVVCDEAAYKPGNQFTVTTPSPDIVTYNNG